MIREARGDDDVAHVIRLRERLDPFVSTTVEDTNVLVAQMEASLQLLADDTGFGFVGRWPAEHEADLDLGVVPAARGRGLGSQLFERLLAFAREHEWPSLLAATADDDARAWLERRGFEQIDRQERVVLDLAVPCDNLSRGRFGGTVTDLASRPELAPRLAELGAEATADVPGALAAAVGFPTLEVWLGEFRAPSRREDFVVIALDGDEPVGWAQLNVYPRVGYHGLTAVARTHRRRGVARALKLELIRRAREHGLERLLTNSNVDNVAMRALNAELGYRPAPPRIFMRRSV